jgi:LPXTG-motif cell wall-anchored protein
MNETLIQAGIWLVAGGIMVVFLRRRKSRRNVR